MLLLEKGKKRHSDQKSKEKIDQIDAELCEYFNECFPLFKSLVTFGDTDHTDVPIYMDGRFREVRERDKETSSVGSVKR